VTRRNSSPLGSPAGWRSAAKVVAISQAVAAQLKRDGIVEDRIVVVPSGVDAEAIRATPRESLRDWAQIGAGMPVIVTVAAVTEEKGLQTALAACLMLLKRPGDLRWVVIGDGALRAGLQGEAALAGIADRFTLPGHHPDPARLMRDADLFVLPSLSEGLGTSVLDAMALDIPVVTTDAGGLPELVGSDAGLVVPAGDADALEAAIGRMLADPELRQRSIEGGRRVVERFSVRAMAEGMRSVYDSVVANH
jgi:glycosyltransferase involved in cell wall biosynthesis